MPQFRLPNPNSPNFDNSPDWVKAAMSERHLRHGERVCECGSRHTPVSSFKTPGNERQSTISGLYTDADGSEHCVLLTGWDAGEYITTNDIEERIESRFYRAPVPRPADAIDYMVWSRADRSVATYEYWRAPDDGEHPSFVASSTSWAHHHTKLIVASTGRWVAVSWHLHAVGGLAFDTKRQASEYLSLGEDQGLHSGVGVFKLTTEPTKQPVPAGSPWRPAHDEEDED